MASSSLILPSAVWYIPPMKTLSILIVLLTGTTAFAQSLDVRLNKELSTLESKLTSADSPGKAWDLLRKGGRDSAFKLQAYGRLFGKDFKELRSLRDDFKALEDHIGQAKKWNDLLAETTIPAKKEKYKQNLAIEINKLAGLITEWETKDKLNQFKKVASDIKMDETETVNLAEKNLEKEAEYIAEKKYDFTYGETGLHELRRNIRWPKIYVELFSANIVMKKAKCSASPNDLYNLGVANNKAIFKGLAPSMSINECAYMKLVGAVELLGQIKDELERNEVLDDKLPKDIREKTVKIYKELEDDILKKL